MQRSTAWQYPHTVKDSRRKTKFKESIGYMSNLVKKCQLETSSRKQLCFPIAVALLGDDDIQRLSVTA